MELRDTDVKLELLEPFRLLSTEQDARAGLVERIELEEEQRLSEEAAIWLFHLRKIDETTKGTSV
jgi:hypothetical protein